MGTCYVGIDPGKNGGLAWVEGADRAECEKLPQTPADLARKLYGLWTDEPFGIYVAVEKVSSSPQQGVRSAFTFGQGYGEILGALSSLGVLLPSKLRYELVRPQVWQSAMGCLSRGDKNVTKRAAQALWPQLKITHATADALLIAEWLRRRETRATR